MKSRVSDMRDAAWPHMDDITAARARIAPYAAVTPVLRSPTLDALTGASVWFKCEALQRGGSFKFRGACNAVWALSDGDAARGVVTQSSGNHGTAVTLAAATRGIRAHIVIPDGAVETKVENIRRAGAAIYRCAPTLAAREAMCAQVQRETGAYYIHPYAAADIIAGQGTVVAELLDQVPALDAVIVPIGGGGLAAGSAVVLMSRVPHTALFGVEPLGADDAYRSIEAGHRVTDQVPHTLCDGLRATIGEVNLAIFRQHRGEVLRVDDDATVAAMRLLWQELKLTVEPSSATVMAALLANPDRFHGKCVGLVLTGGNVDLGAVPFLGGA